MKKLKIKMPEPLAMKWADLKRRADELVKIHDDRKEDDGFGLMADLVAIHALNLEKDQIAKEVVQLYPELSEYDGFYFDGSFIITKT